jgi:hypothetical protein
MLKGANAEIRMTRSIFDPTGGETEHSGSQNLGPDASEISHMPPDAVDGVVDCDEENDTIDMGLVEPPVVSDVEPPTASSVETSDTDAPQESDVAGDSSVLMEGQASDDADAPQEASE